MLKITSFLQIGTSFSNCIDGSFDRVLSIEMFEHMKNYEFLLKKVSNWLKSNGKLFLHIFCHKSDPYDMENGNLMFYS